MANTIDKAFVEQFRSNVVHLSQQQGSRLRRSVNSVTTRAEKHNFERIGVVEAVEKTTRHTDTPVLNVPHSRRVVSMKDWQWADLVDEEDKIRMLINPESEYAKAGAWAMGRVYDDLIIDAARADATDGDGNAVSFDANNVVAVGTSGMTITKLLAAREILLANDVDEYMEPMWCVVTAKQMTDLLNTTEITSADYNSVKALVNGEINQFLGFNFIRTERVDATTTTRHCLAYCQSAIGLAIGRDVISRIDPRPDKSYAMQVYLAFTADATRIEEEKVVQIDCSEA